MYLWFNPNAVTGLCVILPSAAAVKQAGTGDKQPESQLHKEGRVQAHLLNSCGQLGLLVLMKRKLDRSDGWGCVSGRWGTQGGCPTGWLNNWQCRTTSGAQSSSQPLSEWEFDWSWVTRCIGARPPRGWISDLRPMYVSLFNEYFGVCVLQIAVISCWKLLTRYIRYILLERKHKAWLTAHRWQRQCSLLANRVFALHCSQTNTLVCRVQSLAQMSTYT